MVLLPHNNPGLPVIYFTASLFVAAFAIDLLEEGRTVIIQRDVEHVLIRNDISNTKKDLFLNRKSILNAKRMLAGNKLNSKDLNLKAFFKQLDFMTKETELRITKFDSLFNLNKQQIRTKKRGIEILGEFLSTVTGIPSARDHRQILEQLRLLKLDASEIQSLIKTDTDTNRAILNSLHLHEGRIDAQEQSIEWVMGRISAQQSYAETLLEVLNFKARSDLHLAKADAVISNMENILQEGRLERVSETAIDSSSLSQIIEKIILKHRILRPVFEGRDTNKYFQLNSAHSWAEDNSSTVFSLLQIPMADMSDRNEVMILSPSNMLHSDLGIALVNRKARYFRYLSDSDYLRCIPTESTKVCQKRHIEIDFDVNCDPNECADWANLVVHDLTNTEIMVIQPTPTSATLECPNSSAARSVMVPASAIIRISTECSLSSKRYRIDKLSFAKFEWDRQTGIDYNVESESSVRAFRPVSQEQITKLTNDSGKQIELAMSLNNQTVAQLEEYSSMSEKRWKNMTAQRTGIEQLLIWSLIAANLALTLLLGVCVISIKCRQKYATPPPKNSNSASYTQEMDNASLWKELRELKRRIMGVEDGLLQTRTTLNPCTDIMQAPSAPPKEEEID